MPAKNVEYARLSNIPKGLNMTDNKYFLAFFASLTAALLVAMACPLNIYANNIYEFSSRPTAFLFASIPYFVGFFVVLFMPILIPWKKFKDIYLWLLSSVLVVSIINSYFLFGYYGEFDGSGLEIELFTLVSMVQILVLCSIAYFAFFEKIRKYMIYGGGIFVFSNFFLNFYTTQFLNSDQALASSNAVSPIDSFVKLSKDKPNYLYIILDQVYGVSAQDVFEKRQDLREQFTGFTNFTNTASAFPTTMMSIPAILTGEVYDHSLTKQDFYKMAFKKSPLLTTLLDKGFDVSIVSKSYYRDALRAKRVPLISTLGGVHLKRSNEYFEALNLGLFTMVPDFLKNAVYREDNWIFKSNVSFWVSDFDVFVDNVNEVNPAPTFRVLHSLLTHSPVKHNRSCKLLGKTLPGKYSAFLEQDMCGFMLVSRIIARLKELGIYDNTYIIVSSDHGRSRMREGEKKKFQSLAPFKQVGQAHAMLMVKPFNAKGEFRNDSTPASLLDIAPIILGSINNDIPVPNEKRRKYHGYEWSHAIAEGDQFPPYNHIFYIGHDISNPDDWSKTTFDSPVPEEMLNQINIFADIGVGQVNVNDVILFGSNDQQVDILENKYIAKGLSAVEPWGRWSVDEIATIRFRIDDASTVTQLVLELSPSVNSSVSTQKVGIFINQVKIGEVSFAVGKKYSDKIQLTVPNELLISHGFNELTIHNSELIQPKNGDKRKLGVGLKSMQFI